MTLLSFRKNGEHSWEIRRGTEPELVGVISRSKVSVSFWPEPGTAVTDAELDSIFLYVGVGGHGKEVTA